MSNTSDKKKKRRLARLQKKKHRSVRSLQKQGEAEQRVEETLQRVIQLVNEGAGSEAAEVAATLTEQQPTSWRAWNLLGTVQDHIHEFEKAEASFRRVTELAPEQPEGWRSLGKLLNNRGESDAAQECLAQAVKHVESNHAVLIEMARSNLVQQKTEQAVIQIEQAYQLAPEDPDVLNILGLVRQQQGQMEEAALAFCQAAERRENFTDALANLGECLRHLGQIEQAEQILKKTLELDPKHKNALGMMGLLLSGKGQKQASIPYFEEALRLNPRYKLFRLQLARNLASDNRIDESLEHLETLCEMIPDAPEPLVEKAAIYAMLSDTEQTRAYCEKALKIQPDYLPAQIRGALALPQVCLSNEEIQWHRQHLEATVDRLLAEDTPTQERPLEDFPHALFYLTYHGYNNCEINQKLSKLYRKLYPSANYVAPAQADLTRHRNGKSRIRIAFVSKNFSNHTIGRLTVGLLQKLDREKFEVACYTFPSEPDEFRQKFIEASDHFEILPGDGEDASVVLGHAQHDIIFYPDIGMDPVTYHMAHTRLAPIQCVTWGHPVTTGISTMDYYLSNEGMDSPETQSHYSEELVVLKNLFFYYERPPLLSEDISKELLGLPEDFRLYLCPQTLFKYHPDFDAMLGGILRKDPKSLILMLKLGHESWRQRLLQRFEHSLPDVHKRIVWLPKMTAFKFMHLFRLGDVVLDPYKFGSGNSSLEAMAMGAPFVTCPDEFLRTRATSTYYQRMGITDCITSTPEEYVDKAVEIATNPEYRNELSDRILKRSKILFENIDAVHELENWLVATVQRHAQGGQPHQPYRHTD